MRLSQNGTLKLQMLEARGGKPDLKAYLDGGGVPTIGFGHTDGVRMGMTCTPVQAVAWLDEDVDEAEAAVNRLVKVRLNQNQFDALVIFAFNIGVDAFRASTLLRLLNAGNYAAVPAQMARWCKDRNPKTGKLEVVRGLQNRRNAEIAIWLTPVEDDADPTVRVSWMAEETSRVPVAPPEPQRVLETSTGKAQTGALAAGGAAAGIEVLRDMLGQLEPMAYLMDSLKYLLVFGTLVLIGWTLWDRRKKLRDEGH